VFEVDGIDDPYLTKLRKLPGVVERAPQFAAMWLVRAS
jgi:hypothetical protein